MIALCICQNLEFLLGYMLCLLLCKLVHWVYCCILLLISDIVHILYIYRALQIFAFISILYSFLFICKSPYIKVINSIILGANIFLSLLHLFWRDRMKEIQREKHRNIVRILIGFAHL